MRSGSIHSLGGEGRHRFFYFRQSQRLKEIQIIRLSDGAAADVAPAVIGLVIINPEFDVGDAGQQSAASPSIRITGSELGPGGGAVRLSGERFVDGFGDLDQAVVDTIGVFSNGEFQIAVTIIGAAFPPAGAAGGLSRR